jgi:hypothetical protein
MSEKKTIQFNPDFLKFSNNKTRKNRPDNSASSNGIRLKKPKKKDETFKKTSILKMIRKHQQEKYNKMLESFENKKPISIPDAATAFKSEFEDSKQFMDKLLEDSALRKNVHNSTVRRHNPSSSSSTSLLYDLPLENILEIPNSFNEEPQVKINYPPITEKLNQPAYGCLKNGSLPTYKQWLNSTQKNRANDYEKTNIDLSNINSTTPIERNSLLLRASEMKQRMDKMNLRPRGKGKQKQKRIIRRTFKTGKSTVIPKVAVLISNRTIRNKVSTDGQLLKQKPIEEIKKYLIKRGLIRVGTTAPNDVLRKMYECSVMMCGEVQNHNPDNLLYNFLNSDAA